MSDEHILEGSDAAERPLLSYRQSWLAWAGPVLMLLVCVALCVAGQRYMPEFFWIFAGVGALLVLCMVYRVLLVRSIANGREAVNQLNELQGRFCGRAVRHDD